MKPPSRLVATAVAVLLVACASHASSAPAPSPSSAYCRALSDSVAALTSSDSLPQGGFRRSPSMPSLPAGLAKGGRVRIRVLIRPDGTPDLARLEIQGTADTGFRRQVERALRHAALMPARIDGCPVLGRTDVFITKLSS